MASRRKAKRAAPVDRSRLVARVTPEALDAWHQIVGLTGASFTALIEAAAFETLEAALNSDPDDRIEEWFDRARRITAERLDRRP
jgi:hypothetical protein